MIGIDTVSIERIERVMERYEEHFLRKIFSPKEIKLIRKPSTAAGFWALKEAASKAIGTGIGKSCGFHDIKISKTSLNAPKLKYKKTIRQRYGIKKTHVSITHDQGMAIAVVYNERKC